MKSKEYSSFIELHVTYLRSILSLKSQLLTDLTCSSHCRTGSYIVEYMLGWTYLFTLLPVCVNLSQQSEKTVSGWQLQHQLFLNGTSDR